MDLKNDIQTEVWRPVVGYEELYEVSNTGRVRSLDMWRKSCGNNKAWHRGQILKPTFVRGGYVAVGLNKNGVRKTYTIHRLVALSFIPNDDPVYKTQINHKNEIKNDNRVENLEWCTACYNVNYGSRNKKTAIALQGRKRPSYIGETVAKARSKSVVQCDMDGKFIVKFPSAREAARQTGIPHTNISNCCTGKYNQAGGYIWKFETNMAKETCHGFEK